MRHPQRVLALVLFGLAVGCRALLVRFGGPASASDGPIADWMTPILVADDSGRWVITIRRAGDSTSRPLNGYHRDGASDGGG
jgi:hypothetical protein